MPSSRPPPSSPPADIDYLPPYCRLTTPTLTRRRIASRARRRLATPGSPVANLLTRGPRPRRHLQDRTGPTAPTPRPARRAPLDIRVATPSPSFHKVVLLLLMFKLEDVAMGIWNHEMKKKGLDVRYQSDGRILVDGCEDGYVVAHYQQPVQMMCLWDKIQRKNRGSCYNEYQ